MKTASKVLGRQGFSLMKFCKCQNLNYLFREISFLELPKYSWKSQILRIIEKFKNWKIEAPLVGFLSPCHVKMKSWHTLDTWARWYIDHAGMHGTYGMRFSKLPYALWKCKRDHENYSKLLWYDDFTLPCDQREVWVDVNYWTLFCVNGG